MPYVVLHLANSYYSGTKGLFNCTSAPVPTSMGADKLPLPLATALHTMSTIIDTISPTDISTMHRSCNRDISCAINSESPPLSQTSLPQTNKNHGISLHQSLLQCCISTYRAYSVKLIVWVQIYVILTQRSTTYGTRLIAALHLLLSA